MQQVLPTGVEQPPCAVRQAASSWSCARLTEASCLRVCWLSTEVLQLNPIKLLWSYVRRHITHTHLAASITALLTASRSAGPVNQRSHEMISVVGRSG